MPNGVINNYTIKKINNSNNLLKFKSKNCQDSKVGRSEPFKSYYQVSMLTGNRVKTIIMMMIWC